MNISCLGKKHAKGIALLEVLIAVLVFSIGLLGLAGLQTTSLKLSSNANHLTRINEAARELSERMRNNPPGSQSGGYLIDIAYGDALPAASTCDPCNAIEFAPHDRNNWVQNVSTILPGNWSISVTCQDSDAGDALACTGHNNAVDGSIHTIFITWDEKFAGQRDDNDDALEAELEVDADGVSIGEADDGVLTRQLSISLRI